MKPRLHKPVQTIKSSIISSQDSVNQLESSSFHSQQPGALSLQTNPLPRQVVTDFSWALISTFNLILKGEENSVLPDSALKEI